MSQFFFTNIRVDFNEQPLTKEQFYSKLSNSEDNESWKFVIGITNDGVMRVLYDSFNIIYHSDIARKLQQNGYEVLGGGHIGIDPWTDKVEARWDSDTLTKMFGHDRPSDCEFAQKLLEQICGH